jgi:hypothetical protein
MMITTFGYKQKWWLPLLDTKKIHLRLDADCHLATNKISYFCTCFHASFLPLRALHCVAPTLPCAYFSTRVALQSRHHSLSFPFLTSSRSYTFSPNKPTITPCVSNLISKLVLEAFAFPISKTYNLCWIFLFCLFARVCAFCLGEFAVVADSSRQREKKSSSSSSVCVCVCVCACDVQGGLSEASGWITLRYASFGAC